MKTIKYTSLLIFVFIISSRIDAQQISLIDHYYINPYLTNPAQAGYSGNQINLLQRAQWVNVKGAPLTTMGTLEGSFANRKMGLGLTVYNDIVNIVGRTGAYGTYAYHLPFSDDIALSMGFGIGAEQNRLHFDRIDALNPVEVTLINKTEREMNLNANAGIAFHWKGLNLDFASFQLFGSKFQFENDVNRDDFMFRFLRHYIAGASYKLRFSEDVFGVNPFAQMRISEGNGQQFDFGAVVDYQERFWVGTSYRTNYGMLFYGGLYLFDNVKLAYSYNQSFGNLKTLSSQAHEVMLGIDLNNKKNSGKDTDGDGVADEFDLEENTPQDCPVDKFGVALDDDKDGVPNCSDLELNTPFGATIDTNGIALDSDKDGVIDIYDLEKNTLKDCPVNEQGIALDDDKDGVPNCIDLEKNTPRFITVDENGRGIDKDQDGIYDDFDMELNTPSGCPVDKFGVALDDDRDGIPNCKDSNPKVNDFNNNNLSNTRGSINNNSSQNNSNTKQGENTSEYYYSEENKDENFNDVNVSDDSDHRIKLSDIEDYSSKYNYYVVIGVFKYSSNAKRFQRSVRANLGRNSGLLITSGNLNYVYAKKVITQEDAKRTLDSYSTTTAKQTIQGNPWLWREKK